MLIGTLDDKVSNRVSALLRISPVSELTCARPKPISERPLFGREMPKRLGRIDCQLA